MNKCRISVVVPVYNAEEYLDRCLASILNQDFSSYEVILADDGSSDSSSLICDRYSATDSRFRTIHKVNGGVSSARNAGLSIAKGEYVMFVDSDDALPEGALSRMMENVDGEDLILGGFKEYIGGLPVEDVLPKASSVYPAGRMAEFLDAELRHDCRLLDAPWAKLFRRKALGDMQFCEGLSYAEDKLFVFGFLARCRSVKTVSAPIYTYIRRSDSLGSDLVSDKHLAQLEIFLPLYAEILERLSSACPESVKVSRLYHNDLIGRYVCRILNIFAVRKTPFMTEEYIEWLYSMIRKDRHSGLFPLRPGQIFNMLLYRIGRPSLSAKVYRLSAGICSIFKKRS